MRTSAPSSSAAVKQTHVMQLPHRQTLKRTPSACEAQFCAVLQSQIIGFHGAPHGTLPQVW